MISEKFSDIQKDYIEAKEIYDSSLKKLINDASNFTENTLNEINSNFSKFHTKFEEFLTNISSENYDLSKTQIQDVLTSIENILYASIKHWNILGNASEKVLNHRFKPQDNFFKTAQGILKTNNYEKAEILRKKFLENNLPIQGFISKEKYKLTTSKIEWTALIIGIISLIISLVIIFSDFVNNGMQYWLIRIIAGLGVALVFAGLFKNSIKTNITIPGLVITATGSIAIFFILYFFNPAESPKYEKEINIKKSFLIEKESNFNLLKRLSQDGNNPSFMQELSYNPVYLNVNFLKSINIYKEIEDKKTLNELVELLNTLENINTKIKDLNDANKMMLRGNLADMQSAIISFVTVKDSAISVINLYENISQDIK